MGYGLWSDMHLDLLIVADEGVETGLEGEGLRLIGVYGDFSTRGSRHGEGIITGAGSELLSG